jgi:hypothetical protein
MDDYTLSVDIAVPYSVLAGVWNQRVRQDFDRSAGGFSCIDFLGFPEKTCSIPTNFFNTTPFGVISNSSIPVGTRFSLTFEAHPTFST